MDKKLKKNLISVIVPIFNVGKYLDKCLSSIANQTYKDIEVILIDDGSTDNSSEIAQLFAHKYVNFFYYRKDNGGLSSARNYGLERAVGEFIYFIDSDDWITETYLYDLVNSFDSDTDIVIARYTLEDTIIGKTYVPYLNENFKQDYVGNIKFKEICERHLNAYPFKGYQITNTLMPVWKSMYLHKFIQNNNLRFISEREVGAEDYVFNAMAYILAKKVSLCESFGYYHVIVHGSLSRRSYIDELHRISVRKQVVEEFLESTMENNQLKVSLYTDITRDILTLLYNISKSGYKSINEIKEIISSSLFKEVSHKCDKNFNLLYKLLYQIVRYGGGNALFLTVLVSKPMYKIYRYIQFSKRR